jgi:alanine racemase
MGTESNYCVNQLVVDTAAIKFNLQQIKNIVGKKVEVMPVIKANAFGCGLDIVAPLLKDYKFIGVADINEAIIVKKYCLCANIFILYQPLISDIPQIIENNFHISVCELDFAVALNNAADKPINIHLSIDTGLGTTGIVKSSFEHYFNEIAELKNIKVKGIFSQFSSTESEQAEDIDFTDRQIENFEYAIKIAEKYCGKIPYKHLSNSSGIFNEKKPFYNMVRPGYMIYGYYPEEFFKRYIELKPCMSVTTKIIAIGDIKAGEYIGYNRCYKVENDMTVATLPIGYAHGIDRHMANNGCFVVGKQKAPIIGSICMNLTTVDITGIKGVNHRR